MEYKKLCKTCGKVYCYTDEDLKNNKQNAAMSAISAIGGLASVFGGTIFHTAHLSNQTDKYSDKVVDYTKCPYCNSRNVVTVSDEEYAKIAKNMGPGIASSKKVEVSANATPESLIKRAELFLEDGAWDYADAYADSCLDAEPENAYAYVCKLMAELCVKKLDELADCRKPFDDNDNYTKAIRFANEELKVKLNGYITHINERNKNEELTLVYISASEQMDAAKTEEEFMAAAEVFATIPEFKDSDEKQKFCYIKAEEVRKNTIYNDAKTKMESGIVSNMEEAITLFESVDDWKDSKNQIKLCSEKVEKQKIENKKKVKLYSIIGVAVVAIIALFSIVHAFVIEPGKQYKSAIQLIQDGEYVEAIEAFSELDGFRDSEEQIIFVKEEMYRKATEAFAQRDYDTAISTLLFLGEFKDSNAKIIEIKDEIYNNATGLLNQKEYEKSFLLFRKIYGYKDSNKYIKRFDISYDSMEHIKAPNTEYRGMYESTKNIYDDSGYLIEKKRIYDSGEYTSVTKYTNNSSGFCVREDETTTTEDGYSFPSTKYYDSNGKCIKSISTIGDETSVYNYSYEYIYDENNRCIKEICNHDDGESETHEYTYDSNGNCIKEVYVSAYGNNYSYTIVRTYNKKGILEQEVYEKRGVKNTSKYNEFGDCIYFEHDYVDNDESYKEERIYNQFGDCIKVVTTKNNGSVITTEYLYDEYGRELKYGSNLKKSTEIDGEYSYSGLRITFK